MMHRLGIVLVMLAVSACSTTMDRTPVPIESMDLAAIPNIPDARSWADEPPADIDAEVAEVVAQRRASGLAGKVTMLALSGGADDGAFGAGLMNAWTDLGTRPEFSVVTGVSTGALMAPFVFLGPEYDEVLTQVYGGYPPEQIFRPRSWVNILRKASFVDTAPLAQLIEVHADEELLAAVAREHRRGRRLFVQSTNLDAQRPVIWNLGAIADSGAPNALEVFRKALLSSASIPVGFPAVMFDVEVDGEAFDEMHVDGGVISETTVLAGWQGAIDRYYSDNPGERDMTLYVVRNGRIDPTAEITDHHIADIAARSVSTLIYAQGVLGMVIAYDAAQLRGAEYYATWIGPEFDAPYPGPFDQDYMKALSQYGYDLMSEGRAWRRRPPIFSGDDLEVAQN